MKPPVSIEKDDLITFSKLPQVKKLIGKKPNILEIGTWMGGSSWTWMAMFDPEILISVDSVKQDGFIPVEKNRKTQRVEYLFTGSHSDKTKDAVLKILNKKGVDILFIDGDHSYEGVKKDWEMYSILAEPGGIVIFHDALYHADGSEEVDIFWNEIKGKYKHVEIKSSPNSTGMGVLFL